MVHSLYNFTEEEVRTTPVQDLIKLFPSNSLAAFRSHDDSKLRKEKEVHSRVYLNSMAMHLSFYMGKKHQQNLSPLTTKLSHCQLFLFLGHL